MSSRQLQTRVPKCSPLVLDFCNELSPGHTPEYLQVSPPLWAKKNECFVNVRQKIKENEGDIQYGWQIWEWPQVMLEAEFHAVWVSPKNKLIDITPKPSTAIRRILFLPDPNKIYNNQQVNSVRQPLKDDPLINDFIHVSDAIFAITNEGDLKNHHGSIRVSNESSIKLSILRARLSQIALQLRQPR